MGSDHPPKKGQMGQSRPEPENDLELTVSGALVLRFQVLQVTIVLRLRFPTFQCL